MWKGWIIKEDHVQVSKVSSPAFRVNPRVWNWTTVSPGCKEPSRWALPWRLKVKSYPLQQIPGYNEPSARVQKGLLYPGFTVVENKLGNVAREVGCVTYSQDLHSLEYYEGKQATRLLPINDLLYWLYLVPANICHNCAWYQIACADHEITLGNWSCNILKW